jgi:Spy/CpxP family protein refolding chaperone
MKIANKTLATLFAAGLTLGVASSAFAFGSHEHGCNMGDRLTSPMRALSQLDSLTDEQRTKIKDLMKEERKTMRDLFDAMQDNRDDLQEAMQKSVPADEIKPLAKKQGDLVAEMTIARANLRDKINTILTEEQRKQLSEMKPQKRTSGDDRDRGGHQGW